MSAPALPVDHRRTHDAPRSARRVSVTWVLLTGEYPPQRGGVADYTRRVAQELVRRGERVIVVAPGDRTATTECDGVVVRTMVRPFGPRGLRRLGRLLASLPQPRRVLLQYVPYAFGMRSMNVLFPLWLRALRGTELWTMWHEVAYPRVPGAPLRHRLLARTHEWMARQVARTTHRGFAATAAWIELLGRLAPDAAPPEWRPVPSNVPTRAAQDAHAVARRAHDLDGDTLVVGHFGTLRQEVVSTLDATLARLAARVPGITVLLIGRGSVEHAARLAPELATQGATVRATGGLGHDEVARTIAACDVLLQPYDDGATTRRGSLMACLGVGAAVVTNAGPASDAVWRESGAVALGSGPDADELARLVTELLDDPGTRDRLRAAARRTYAQLFSVERTVDALLAESPR